MSTDPLDRYQSMMHDTHVPAHLPDQVLEQARARLAADKAESAAASCASAIWVQAPPDPRRRASEWETGRVQFFKKGRASFFPPSRWR